MSRTELPSGPWQYLAADMLGPMLTGESILVVIDYYIRYFEISILRSTTSEKIVETMTKLFVTHGLPLAICTDNTAKFTSETFKSFLREHGFIHHRNQGCQRMFEYSNIRNPFEYSNTVSEFEYSHFYLTLRCAF